MDKRIIAANALSVLALIALLLRPLCRRKRRNRWLTAFVDAFFSPFIILFIIWLFFNIAHCYMIKKDEP